MTDVVVLTCKALLAVMFVIAGSAKLADPDAFASAVRLFTTTHVTRTDLRRLAFGVAAAEVTLGGVSLVSPSLLWVNIVVAAATVAFVVVSVLGYVFYRGRQCRCFGALSTRGFDGLGIARSVLIASCAAVAMVHVSVGSTAIDSTQRSLLACVAVLVAFAAIAADKALSRGRKLGLVAK